MNDKAKKLKKVIDVKRFVKDGISLIKRVEKLGYHLGEHETDFIDSRHEYLQGMYATETILRMAVNMVMTLDKEGNLTLTKGGH